MRGRESQLAEITEDVARLAASHQSADRFFEDAQKRLAKAESEEMNAKAAVAEASTQASDAAVAYEQAHSDEAAAVEAVAQAETALAEAEARRADCLTQENSARTARAEANGVVHALQAELSALAKLVERNRGQGDQLLDQVHVQSGYEKALGAALADDLKAPAVTAEGRSGWAQLQAYDTPPRLPEGVESFGKYVTVPGVLNRRIAQVGLVTAEEGARLHGALLPGQRLVSR